MKRLLLGLLCLCSILGNAIFTNACGNGEWYPADENFLFTFQGEEAGSTLQHSFHIAAGEEFGATCTLTNLSPQAVDLCATLFLNYNQVPFEWNGSPNKMVHLLSMERDQRETYSMRTLPLTESYYEFMLVLFSHPFFHSANDDWRRVSSLARYWWRANLYVGDAVLPAIEFPHYVKGNGESFLSPVSISLEPITKPTPRWSEKKVKALERVDYFVNLSNSEEKEEAFALVCLLDYRQIQINLDSNELVSFGVLPELVQVHLPASFESPPDGIHELVVLRIPRPYVQIENPPGVLASVGWVESSGRTLIVVNSNEHD